jgi:hypothetical protein
MVISQSIEAIFFAPLTGPNDAVLAIHPDARQFFCETAAEGGLPVQNRLKGRTKFSAEYVRPLSHR